MYFPKLNVCLILALLLCFGLSRAKGQSEVIRQEQQKLLAITDSIALIDCMNRIGFLYYMKNPDSSFYYSRKAKGMAISLNYPRGITDADNVTAALLYLKGFYRESLEMYGRVLTAYKQQADTANVIQVIMNMGVVYSMGITDHERALSLFKQTIEAGKKLKQDSIMSLVYVNYCISNFALSYDSAQIYLDKSWAIANRNKDKRMQVVILQVRADRFIRNGQKREALRLINYSLSESRKTGLEYLEINSFYLYAAYYANKPDSALHYYQQAYNLAEQKGYVSFRVPLLNKILAHIELSGNKDKIISTQKLLQTALVTDNSNIKKFIGDYVKYNSIQEANAVLGIINKNNKTKIWLLMAACSIAALLMIFIYWQYRTSNRLNKQIIEQNDQMGKALSALEQSQQDNTRMMQIVAHDLRNPIGGMTSLASLLLDEHNISEDQQMMLELIKTSGENSLALVNDLLQVHTSIEDLKKSL